MTAVSLSKNVEHAQHTPVDVLATRNTLDLAAAVDAGVAKVVGFHHFVLMRRSRSSRVDDSMEEIGACPSALFAAVKASLVPDTHKV